MESGAPGLESAFFPLVFLWRHHHELALKEIIGLGVELDLIAQPTEQQLHRHSLTSLWALARPALEGLANQEAPELPIVEHSLLELQNIDPGSDQFRYPTARNGAASLAEAPSSICLDSFQEAMVALEFFFDCALDMMTQKTVVDPE